MPNSIIEVQDTITNEQRSDHQEVSDRASARIDQVTPDEKHIRAAQPAQDESCGQRSDHQEVSDPARSNHQEVSDWANTRIGQVTKDESNPASTR